MTNYLEEFGIPVVVVLFFIGIVGILLSSGLMPTPGDIVIWLPTLPFWAYGIIIVALSEVFFFLDNDDKPSKKSKVFEHTIGQKLLWLFISTGIVGAVQGIAIVIYVIFPFVYENWFSGLQAIGVVAIIIVGLYLYVKINSLKYRKVKYKTNKKRGKN